MPKQESPFEGLKEFLPDNTFDDVIPFFKKHTIILTLCRHRETRLGDYRAPTKTEPYHRISVNATLNKYSFLITLLHELAHLNTHVGYSRRAAPHGREWKQEFQKLLLPVMGRNIFPDNVEMALREYLLNPAASTCADPILYKALASHDHATADFIHADEVAINAHFALSGRVFEKLENRRTRVRCKDVRTGKLYLVAGVAQVRLVD